MKKVFKIVSLILAGIITLGVCYYVSLIAVFHIDLKSDYKKQIERMEALEQSDYEGVDESSFVDFDIYDNTRKLNDIQVLATHNSFKSMPNMYISKPIELFWGQKVRNGQYAMPYLTEQLNNGIRGVEIDIAAYGDDFLVIHDPTTDWRTHVPDFELALREIKLWSDRNPNHIPINIMLQARNQFSVYTAKFKKFDKQRLTKLNDIMGEVFGRENIIKPSDLLGEYNSIQEAVQNNNWPMLSDCLGKVYFSFLFDEKESEQNYIALDQTLNLQNGFVFAKKDAIKPYTAFILADSPFVEGHAELAANNYILRTRIDEQFNHSQERFQATIDLGAVILSTDYPIGNTYDDGYICKLTEDNKTVISKI